MAMVNMELAFDVTKKLFIPNTGMHVVPNYFENVPHEVLFFSFTLEHIFSKLHPRMVCRAVRVCRAWRDIAYAQHALWRDVCVDECVRSAQHAETLLQPRFELLRSLSIPASLVRSHGTPTHCAHCTQPLPEFNTQDLGYVCRCAFPMRDYSKGDICTMLTGRFADLQRLSLHIPSRYSIDPACLAQMTQLTHLRIENMNPVRASAYSELITRNPQLRGLTYLTRPWIASPSHSSVPFSYAGLQQLESLEVNQVNFAEILHMTSTLKSLKVNGYAPIDKYMKNICMQNVESIVCFTQLESLDISGMNPTEVSNSAWTALHICMLTNLQVLDVGPLFSMEDFAWMSRDLVSLRSVGIHDNIYFSNTLLQDFSAMDLAANITSLHLRNCMGTLQEPACLASFPQLRSLHIQQDTQQAGTLRKLVPTIVQMTQLVDLALVGLSINPVQIYPKLTNLQRLVLNRTPMSDADVFILTKKLTSLRHLGLVGCSCYYVTLKGLLSLVSLATNLQVLEWDEPSHVKPLLEVNPELQIITPEPADDLQPLMGLSNLDPPPKFNPDKLVGHNQFD